MRGAGSKLIRNDGRLAQGGLPRDLLVAGGEQEDFNPGKCKMSNGAKPSFGVRTCPETLLVAGGAQEDFNPRQCKMPSGAKPRDAGRR